MVKSLKLKKVDIVNNELEKLLIEYKETERCMKMSIDYLNDKDYARGKLDLIRTIIVDLEKLSQTE